MNVFFRRWFLADFYYKYRTHTYWIIWKEEVVVEYLVVLCLGTKKRCADLFMCCCEAGEATVSCCFTRCHEVEEGE